MTWVTNSTTFLAFLTQMKLRLLPPNSACGLEIVDVHSDTFYPLSFRYDARESRYCHWSFITDPGYISLLECSAINLPPSPACSIDKLTITAIDGSTMRDNFCDHGYEQLVIFGTQIDVVLHTSRNTTGGHFICQLTAMLANCSCGYKYPQPQPEPQSRIYNGVETDVNEFPMMALLHIRVLNKNFPCGGTIISKRIVMTVAHCVASRDKSQFTVYAGEHDITTAGETNATQRFSVQEVIIHERYRTIFDTHYDIALLRLDRDIQFSERVGPACLPFRYIGYDFSGIGVKILGWGKMANMKFATKLQKADVNRTNLDFCRYYYPYATEEVFCTYSDDKDACQGDSGGPVLYSEPGTGRQFVIGIISRGLPCDDIMYPGLNVDVVHKLEWITDNTPDTQYCTE